MAELNEFFLLQKDKLSFSASIGGVEGKVRDIHKAIFEEGFIHDALRSAVEHGCLILKVGGERYFCKQSFSLRLRNYLVFISASGEGVILEQRHKVVSEIIFPKEKMVFKYDKNPSQAKEVLSSSRVRRALDSESTVGGGFRGILLSYGRPYHFFYDLLPPFISYYEENSEAADLIKKSGLVCVKDKTFIEPRLFMCGEVPVEWVESEQTLNERDGFFLKIGYPLKNFKQERERLINSSTDKIKSKLVNVRMTKANPDPSEFRLWVGICTEKRSWDEASKGIQEVVETLLLKYEKVSVLVDGLTRPEGVDKEYFFSMPSVKKEIEKLSLIFGKYKEDSRVNVFNLIGETASFKISAAQDVDFFITNFLTDSMYPARFACRPGIGHGSYRAKYSDHVHPNTTIVKSHEKWDKRLINKSSNWAKQNYSIPSKVIVAKLKKILDI